MTISSQSARVLTPILQSNHGIVATTTLQPMPYAASDSARSLSSMHTFYSSNYYPREVGPFCVTAAIMTVGAFINQFNLKMVDGAAVTTTPAVFTELTGGAVGRAVLSTDLWIPDVNTYLYAQIAISSAVEILTTFSLRRVA